MIHILKAQPQIDTYSALERKVRFQRAVSIHSTPVRLIASLAIVANGSRLPRLVESLKVEDVDAPIEEAAAIEFRQQENPYPGSRPGV